MDKTDFEIEAFLVTDMKGNPSDYFNIPVREISEVEVADSCIIIATLERLHDKIEKSLRELGYNNIYTISDDEYSFIRHKYLDLSGESFRMLCNAGRTASSINKQVGVIDKQVSIINKRVNGVLNFLKSENEHVVSEGEKLRYVEEFRKFIEDQEQYKLKVSQLIHNLDSESTETVFQILHRLHMMCDEKRIFYNKEEKKAIRCLKDEFYSKVYKIAEECYYYNGYYLPKDNFEPTVFWYEHGIKELKHLEYIMDKDIIDAGGYIGDSAFVLSKYTRGKVYSFEALKRNYYYIEKTAEMNHLDTIGWRKKRMVCFGY